IEVDSSARLLGRIVEETHEMPHEMRQTPVQTERAYGITEAHPGAPVEAVREGCEQLTLSMGEVEISFEVDFFGFAELRRAAGEEALDSSLIDGRRER